MDEKNIQWAFGMIILMVCFYFLMLKLIFEGFNQQNGGQKSSYSIYFLLYFEVILAGSILFLGYKWIKLFIEYFSKEKK